jgi:hypothetical protein
LQDGDQRQPLRRQRRLAAAGIEVDAVVIADDGAEFITEPETGVAPGEGSSGDARGLVGDGEKGAWAAGTRRYPKTGGVGVMQTTTAYRLVALP